MVKIADDGVLRLLRDVQVTLEIMNERVEREKLLSYPNYDRFIQRLEGMAMLLLHKDLLEAKQLVHDNIQRLRELNRQCRQ